MLRILFAGTPQLASYILQELLASDHNIMACFTQADKPTGRGQKLAASPVKQCALAHNLPIYQPATLKSHNIAKLIMELKPDIAVVVAYGLLIPKELLTIPRYGFLNIHMSLLPRWRGAAPIQYAILAGEQTTGVSIMQMDAELDTGDILKSAKLEITSTDTSATLQDKLTKLGVIELKEVLTQLVMGKVIAVPQEHQQATYTNKITKQSAKITWQQSAKQIALQIRAYNPWPVAFTYSNEIAIRIWEAIVISDELRTANSMPGTILQVTKQGIDVATATGIIRLQKLQLPNKKPLMVAEIIKANNHPFIPGIILQ